ncbi:NurA domain protein [Candidatus Tiddalikarchaeum anstoanum]|nr:NurA domain protein [Candidatus Tiddalikarchaeum anstoanum]
MINAVNFIKSYERKSEGKIFAIGKDKGVLVSEKNFKQLSSKKSADIFAIDGGNAIIADGGGWIISLLKVVVAGYNGYEKKIIKKKDYLLTILHKDNFEFLLESEGRNIDIKLPDFSNEEIENVPSKVMKILEWQECMDLCRMEKQIIIMDSPLDADNKTEEDIIKNVEKTNNVVVGFSKTSRLRTNTGRSFLGVLNHMVKGREWYYYPIFENEPVNTFVVKLNKRAKFCNKVQVFKKEKNFDEIFSYLSFFANDSEMLGYPYPLIKADKLARITGFEKKKESVRIERLLKKANLDDDLYSQNEHGELDMRMYRNLNQKS